MQVFQKTIIASTSGSEDTLYHYCILRGDLALVDLRHTKCSDFQLNYLTVLNYLEENKLPMSALGTARLVEYESKESVKKEQGCTYSELVAKMVDAVLAWPLPKTVRPDGCVMDPTYQSQLSGTHLLNATEAESMVRFILGSVDVIGVIADESIPTQTVATSVIYSRSEEQLTGAGYWNLTEGWSRKDKANHFSDTVFPDHFQIPKSIGRDTILVPSSFNGSFDVKIPHVSHEKGASSIPGPIVMEMIINAVEPTKEECEVRNFLKDWSALIDKKYEIIYLDEKCIVKSDEAGVSYIITDNYQPKELSVGINFDDDQLFKPLTHILIDHLQVLNKDVSSKYCREAADTRSQVIKHLMFALSIYESLGGVVGERD